MARPKLKLGDKCPRCGGSGLELTPGDLHRSEGWVSCRWHNDTFECHGGKLGRCVYLKPSKAKRDREGKSRLRS